MIKERRKIFAAVMSAVKLDTVGGRSFGMSASEYMLLRAKCL